MPNMILIKRINLLAEAIGADIKNLNNITGHLANLDNELGINSANNNLVSAINYTLEKARTAATTTGTSINDSTKSNDSTWSSNKISTAITNEVSAIIDSAPEAFNTLKEVADWIEGNSTAITAISNKVPYNETKDLTDEQKQNVWTTIGIGNYANSNFLETYNTAKK